MVKPRVIDDFKGQLTALKSILLFDNIVHDLIIVARISTVKQVFVCHED
jgi:hypothetical protein